VFNILYLGKKENKVFQFLQKNETISHVGESEEIRTIDLDKYDLIVSYGYRKIIGKEVTQKFKNKIINLHISYLPWNRGAFPNVWSFIDNTPKGVTIHYIDEGIDTGDILLQKLVHFENLEEETFETTYRKLSTAVEDLFIENWDDIRNQNIIPKKQNAKEGTTNYVKSSINKFEEIGLNQKWSMKVSDFIKFKRTDDQIIDDIQNIRKQNNTHWMDVVRLAFRETPEEARDIFKRIKFCDYKVNELLKELADNEQ
jgi:methionyl-tRNA formyltransferase